MVLFVFISLGQITVFFWFLFLKVSEGLSKHVLSSEKDQANCYRKLLEAWREAKPPPKTPEEASRLIIQTLKRHQNACVQGLLAFYGLPLTHNLVPLSSGVPTSLPVEVMFEMQTLPVPTSLPEGVKFEMQTLPVDARAVPDGDTISFYVSAADSRESSLVPRQVHMVAVKRLKARAERNYEKADALHQQIINSGYRVIHIQNEEILARKYRIRLRGIDAPESEMPYGKEAQEELVKLVGGKCLRIFVYGEDWYDRCVGDIYCDGIFVQEVMLQKVLAWHYSAYDQRWKLAQWEKEARAKHVGLWASKNPEAPWEWRRARREGR